MDKIIFNVLDMGVMDILKRFYYPVDRHFIVQNVKSDDNKYSLTKTHVMVI